MPPALGKSFEAVRGWISQLAENSRARARFALC
jgi:hypothetical protein